MREMTGKKVLTIAVCWFLLVIAANSVFLTRAFETRKGLVIENAYKYGVNYNETHREWEQQEAKGLRARAELQDTLDGKVKVIVEGFHDGKPTPITSAKIDLIRLVEPTKDQHLTTSCTGNVCEVSGLMLHAGQWDIKANLITADNDAIRLEQRIVYGMPPSP